MHVTVVVADLPGLIAGAAEHNVGLGAEFLSLIGDCRLLAFVVDIGTPWASIVHAHASFSSEREQLDRFTEQVLSQLVMLRHELALFDPALVNPDRTVVLGTKLDLAVLPPSATVSKTSMMEWQLKQRLLSACVQAELLRPLDHDKVILVSARRGDHTDELVRCIAERYRRSDAS